MQKILASSLLSAGLLSTGLLYSGSALAQPTTQSSQSNHIGRHDSNPADIAAINQVTQDFRAALISKNIKQLSSLMLNSNILFSSPGSASFVKKINDSTDVNFDGIRSGGYPAFADFVANSADAIEEKFYNIKITQDGHVGWVMFDFEFLSNKKVENYGVETWQLLKAADGKWKIFSVVWSSHGAPK
ncbi:nuclear transport factor 2 family protein [Undibacterium terreum]|uniref:SnoaL-like domain-containing protein n=1 Tax=Undibacterium terreum TaxID=1224302 RepID=A0A916XEK7_9BURK|nr:nuclear transport factor 2 family protein [Undibacterium terreum]GGC66187.1 hypothetical protein GCM10011396_11510 [Undibacterium terreum]